MSTFHCNSCSKLATNMGSRIRVVDRKPSRVCAACAPDLPLAERSKKAKQGPRKPPKNDDFTTGRYGVPIGTKDYIGRDVRFQCGPEEIKALKKTGFYATQMRQLMGKK